MQDILEPVVLGNSNASVNSKCQPPPPGQPLGIFEVVKSPALEQNVYAKAWSWSIKSTYSGKYFRRSS